MRRDRAQRARLGRDLRARLPAIAISASIALAIGAGAEEGDAEDREERAATYEFTVTERLPVTASSTLTVPAEDLELRPLESGGQILEAVPGLVTAQHTGGGKAEQYFIRGFDADHGTDLAVYFDGVPVNLRSHAHGQGFLDLHFVIPETVARLDAYKGPYFAQYGDFATAAAVEYAPYERLPESFVHFEAGEFDTQRYVALLSPRSGPFAEDGAATGLLAFEAYHTDGPFNDEEDLWRYSLFGRAGVEVRPGLELSGHVIGYKADWHASGLIPERLVDAGQLSRWGSLDPTEGGRTRRAQTKLQLDWKPRPGSRLMANAYVSYYDFELFSNFTYFLNDPDRGDGIVQRDEDRIYTGGRVEYLQLFDALFPTRLRLGAETRFDDVDVVLADQTRRNLTDFRSSNRVRELSVEPYAEAQVMPLEWVRVVGGLRFAWFRFDGRDQLGVERVSVSRDSLWMPKANLILSPFGAGGPLETGVDGLRELEFFGNFGIGYHSNDARAVFDDSGRTALPKATGYEIGARTRLLERVDVAVSYWWLDLEDEFVFVGDEGTTESAGETSRHGVEVVARAQLLDWLRVRGEVSYTDAEIDDSNRPVPQAPRLLATGAVGVEWQGFAAELGVRHLGSRYASEDFYSPKLDDYTVLDLGMRYRWRFLEVGLALENITDTKWRSSEFYYESCTQGELGNRPECSPATGVGGREGVGDFHFTPGNPRNVRGWIRASF